MLIKRWAGKGDWGWWSWITLLWSICAESSSGFIITICIDPGDFLSQESEHHAMFGFLFPSHKTQLQFYTQSQRYVSKVWPWYFFCLMKILSKQWPLRSTHWADKNITFFFLRCQFRKSRPALRIKPEPNSFHFSHQLMFPSPVILLAILLFWFPIADLTNYHTALVT